MVSTARPMTAADPARGRSPAKWYVNPATSRAVELRAKSAPDSPPPASPEPASPRSRKRKNARQLDLL